MKSILNNIKKLKQNLFMFKETYLSSAFPILKQPESIRKMKTRIIIMSILATGIFDVLSFALKGAESAISKGKVPFGVLLLVLYFSEKVLRSSYETFAVLKNDLFNEEYARKTTSIIMEFTSLVRNKVFKTDSTGREVIMQNAELLQKTKKYINAVWNLYWRIPTFVSNVLILICMIVSMVLIELRDNSGIQTLIIMGILFICTMCYIILSKKRIKLLKSFRKVRQEANAKEEVLFTEVKSIEYISAEDYHFHAERLRKQMINTAEITKSERLNLNKVFIQRSFIASGFMISILLIKVFYAGKLDLTVTMDVVAVSAIYSTILQKISSLLEKVEELADITIDIKTLFPDFKNIHDVYSEEKAKVFIDSNVERIDIKPFYATQDPKKSYVLHNSNDFSLEKGDIVLVHGPTGSGKSTLLLLLTGKLKIQGSPIKFSNGESGYLKSVAYQTDHSLADNFVFNEIIISDDLNDINMNMPKLLNILHGLCLYTELIRMAEFDTDLNLKNYSDDEKVIELLKLRTTRQFSSGQQQRFALAKLLYSLQDYHQVLALDEAFNRLDDNTAKQVLNFVCEYANKEVKRIILISTHQVTIVAPVCNKNISFTQDLNTAYLHVN